MLAVTANLMESPISRHSYCGEEYLPKPEGLAHPAVAPFDGFKTADGILYIATSNDARCASVWRVSGCF
jgi:crotonobetainyl-CoA:carnitine CoA-transferase CaiB-like acyl-CoA transferase